MRTRGTTEAVFLKAPSGELVLGGGIHLWRFAYRSGDESVLSPSESLQAAKFQSVDARATFVAGRSGIRRVGSLYSMVPADELLVETDANGKPFFSNAAIHFNLSHSGPTVVAAFSGSPVGIDIESRGRCRDFVGIARRFFHPSEATAVAQSGDEADFLRLWTGKEAMLKLSGEGISGGLQDARPGDEGGAMLRGSRICIARFSFEDVIGAVATFEPAEVKGWFQF